MKDYKYKYITETMKGEVDELLKGEHGEALYAWSMECADVAVKGFKHGIRDSVAKGLILTCAVVGAVDIFEQFCKYRKSRKAEKRALKASEAEKQTYKYVVKNTDTPVEDIL